MDLEAFEKRVLPVRNKLFRFALRLLGSEEEAKDIVQEVFTRVWNSREKADKIRNWEAWCMRLTRNLSIDRVRQVDRRQTQSLEPGFEGRHAGSTPEESAEMAESIIRISEAISTLPDKQRHVIHLRDVEGYSYQEIADILEIDINQVKVNLFRARSTIKNLITKINAYGL